MQRLGLSAATALAAALCSAPFALAAATTGSDAAGGGGGGGGKEEVLTLTPTPTQIQTIDVDPDGPSQGDQLIVSGDLLKSAIEVGDYDQFCAVTRTEGDESETFQCQVTLTLPNGSIT